MSTQVLELYERLVQAPDERARAHAIAEAFAALEARQSLQSDLATRAQLAEAELKLVKEIEQVRLETEQVRAGLRETELRLLKEIEQVRAELKETELRLVKEIEQVRAELKVEIARSRAGTVQWSFVFWLTQFSALLAILWRLWPAS